MPDRAFCSDCGATLEADATFCTACGADLGEVGPRRFVRDVEQVESVDELADSPPREGFVLGAYVLGVTALILWPLGFAGVALGWAAHRAGHPKGFRAMVVAGVLTIVGVVINLALIRYCQTIGAGARYCEPVQGL